MYSDAQIMAEKPEVAAFLNFLLTHVNEEIDEVGYFPAAADVLDGAVGKNERWKTSVKIFQLSEVRLGKLFTE